LKQVREGDKRNGASCCEGYRIGFGLRFTVNQTLKSKVLPELELPVAQIFEGA